MAAIPVPSQLLALPPIWREGRTALELAELVRHPVFREVDPDAGDGRPILLVPGFLAGDGSLGVMTGWLRRAGYRAHRTGSSRRESTGLMGTAPGSGSTSTARPGRSGSWSAGWRSSPSATDAG